MSRPKIHAFVGLLLFVLFLLSGLYMYEIFPAIYQGNEVIRYQFRANHIYILMASFINFAFGLATFPGSDGWKKILSCLGSIMIFTASVLLIHAFVVEPVQGEEDRPISFVALVAMLIGMAFVNGQ